MKAILLSVILSLSVFVTLAPAHDDAATARALVGRWRLVEYFNDIGDGKGHLHWQKTDGKTVEILEFKGDGTFRQTMPAPSPKGPSGKYDLTQDKSNTTTIRFINSTRAIPGGVNTWQSTIVKLKQDRLELGGPGIEGSGRRYQREQ